MTRSELIRMFALDIIADDYESLERIYGDVTDLGARCGMVLETSEILQELIALIELSYANAFILTTVPVQKFRGVPPLQKMGDYYYYVTDEGKELVRSECPGWPFDDDFVLREDWVSPKE